MDLFPLDFFHSTLQSKKIIIIIIMMIINMMLIELLKQIK